MRSQHQARPIGLKHVSHPHASDGSLRPPSPAGRAPGPYSRAPTHLRPLSGSSSWAYFRDLGGRGPSLGIPGSLPGGPFGPKEGLSGALSRSLGSGGPWRAPPGLSNIDPLIRFDPYGLKNGPYQASGTDLSCNCLHATGSFEAPGFVLFLAFQEKAPKRPQKGPQNDPSSRGRSGEFSS